MDAATIRAQQGDFWGSPFGILKIFVFCFDNLDITVKSSEEEVKL